ncbi:MAG: formate transporter FocA [Dehalococcoidia bacterium]|nr:MAG: formate transporter FocA [Dehalococcoidia bacterium]
MAATPPRSPGNEQLSLDPLLPAQMAEKAETLGVAKVRMPLVTTFVLAVLAGAFIALGADFFTIVTTDSGLGYGTTRLLGGVAFSLGLLLVVIAGAELFTGNNLAVMAWANRRIGVAELARNWAIVYAGNFVGAIATVFIVYLSGQWKFDGHLVGANAVSIANRKVELGFGEAIALGILCNALVCLAVWLTYSARSNIDKAIAVVFPITAFVASGFEHSIANMYFVPMGLLLKNEDAVTRVDSLSGADFSHLNWSDFLLRNLLPVTIGNVIGGAVMVGIVYWFVYLRPRQQHE